MPSEYLLLAKSHLDYVQAKRAGLSGEQSCAKMMEEADLAVRIAQVEATERLASAMVGVPLLDEPLPFEERPCAHGVGIDLPCVPCADQAGCIDDLSEDCCRVDCAFHRITRPEAPDRDTEPGLVLRRGYDGNGRVMFTEAGPPSAV